MFKKICFALHRSMLKQSITDLQDTVVDLEKKFELVDSEGNEWKTR